MSQTHDFSRMAEFNFKSTVDMNIPED